MGYEMDGELPEQAKPHTLGCPKTWRELTMLLGADLHRYSGRVNAFQFLKHYIFTPGYKYTVHMRSCGYFKVQGWSKWTLYPISKLLLLHMRYKFGISIPEYTQIGPGLFINRFGGIYIGGDCVIGSNVNITHGTLLGYTNRGKRRGCPVVGDRVFFGSGAKAVGLVHIGDGAVVGVNALVTADVPENAVVAAAPAQVLSMSGSDNYINKRFEPAMSDRAPASKGH